MQARERLASALSLAIAIGVLAPSVAHAGPWTPEPGRGYLKLWLKEYCSCGFGYIAPDGAQLPLAFYDEIFVNAYAEVGLAPGLATWVHWPLLQTFLLEDPRPEVGGIRDRSTVGDPTVALRWRFLRIERFVAALDAGVRLPFAPGGIRQAVYSTQPGNPRIGGLRIGTGVWDFPVSLSIGYAWNRIYVAGSGGYVVRSDAFDHVVTWTAEGGGTFEGGLSLRARVTGWHSIGNGDPLLHHASPSGIGSGTSYVGFAIEMDAPVATDWWLGATIEGGLFAISRQAGGPVVTIYVATRFSLVGEPAPTTPAPERPAAPRAGPPSTDAPAASDDVAPIEVDDGTE